MNFKKTFFSAAILAVTLLNTACGGTNTNSTGGTTASAPTKSSTATTPSKPNENAAAEYEYTAENGGITITKYLGKDAEITIPAQIDGKDVKKIGFSFLRSDEEKVVTSVIMPDSITELNNEVFSGNSAIKSITFSKSLKEIPKKVCQNCQSLENVNLFEGIEVIEYMAFNNCDSLKSVVIPDTVKDCSVNAFFACDLLETMTYKGKTYKKPDLDDCYNAINHQQ